MFQSQVKLHSPADLRLWRMNRHEHRSAQHGTAAARVVEDAGAVASLPQADVAAAHAAGVTDDATIKRLQTVAADDLQLDEGSRTAINVVTAAVVDRDAEFMELLGDCQRTVATNADETGQVELPCRFGDAFE